jgi:hypothetical protein
MIVDIVNSIPAGIQVFDIGGKIRLRDSTQHVLRRRAPVKNYAKKVGDLLCDISTSLVTNLL